ncbi:MAG: GWxTD domain-containing protein [Blastocatellia bacterium]
MLLDFKRSTVRRLAQVLICALLSSSFTGFAQDDKKEKEKAKQRKEQQRAGQAERMNSVYKKWMDEDVAYIITDEEKKIFKSLKTDDEREQFIEQFWLRRDPDPDTDVNEYREEYYQRIAYANENFASGIPGWKTDRGRIYIMFGKPDEKESHPSGGSYNRPVWEGGGTTSTYPFETWWYRYLEGVGSDIEIEFVDPSGSGEYRIARNANEKDALLYVPNAGLTLSEELGLSTKADRIAGYSANNTNGNQMFGQRAKDQPFEKLAQLAALQRAPKVKFKDLEATLGFSEDPKINVDVLATGMAINFARVTDSAVMTSFTLQLENSDLVYKSKGGIQEAAANIHARITNVSGRRAALFEDVVTSNYLPEQLETGQKSKSVYQKDLLLPPGTYKIDLVVRDVNSGRTDIKHQGFVVPKYSESELSSSTLVLASRIESLNGRLATGQFIRGQMKVIPNATAEYKSDQTLGLYMQVYNVAIDQATLRPSVDIEYVITHSGKDKEVLKFKEDGKSGLGSLNGQQITLARLIPLKQLPPGSYDVAVKVTDNVAGKSFTRKEVFTVVKSS